MASVVCTLFEGHYHHGVAALINSLHLSGFKGYIFVGYRGKLPKWTDGAKKDVFLKWKDTVTLQISDQLTVHFLPLDTNYHFTNYKPDFLLLVSELIEDMDNMFYFDPDIVITGKWTLFEKWVECGVALCEDINSPMSMNHPRRIAWRTFFLNKGLKLEYKESVYANGGFIGVSKNYIRFVQSWKDVQELMATEIGGLNRSSLHGVKIPDEMNNEFAPFPKTDQDALNATVEAWDGVVSFVGKEAMAFISGTSIMAHALSNPKPWKHKPLISALKGRPAGVAINSYWKHVNYPIKSQSSMLTSFRIISLKISSLIGRFYTQYQ